MTKSPKQELREKIDGLFPETMACDEHETFDTCPVIKAKAEAMHLIDEYVAGIIGEDYDMDWFDQKTGKEIVWTARDIMKQVNSIKAEQRHRAGIGEKHE